MFTTRIYQCLLSLAVACSIVSTNQCFAQGEDDATMIKKSSYIIGFNMVQNLIAQGVEVDQDSMIKGMAAAFQKQELGMDDEEVERLMMAFQRYTEGKMVERLKKEANDNLAQGEKFMADFAAREGVRKLENGVLYQVLKEGTGGKPEPGSKVRIHYHGTMPDGSVFDSSVQRNEPAEFPVSGVVPGFSAALQAMSVGSKWRVVIPSQLAYGANGRPPIGPNRTLVFEIELLDILN